MPPEKMFPEGDFPSFSEGLSLRAQGQTPRNLSDASFPFLFGGTFIEGF